MNPRSVSAITASDVHGLQTLLRSQGLQGLSTGLSVLKSPAVGGVVTVIPEVVNDCAKIRSALSARKNMRPPVDDLNDGLASRPGTTLPDLYVEWKKQWILGAKLLYSRYILTTEIAVMVCPALMADVKNHRYSHIDIVEGAKKALEWEPTQLKQAYCAANQRANLLTEYYHISNEVISQIEEAWSGEAASAALAVLDRRRTQVFHQVERYSEFHRVTKDGYGDGLFLCKDFCDRTRELSLRSGGLGVEQLIELGTTVLLACTGDPLALASGVLLYEKIIKAYFEISALMEEYVALMTAAEQVFTQMWQQHVSAVVDGTDAEGTGQGRRHQDSAQTKAQNLGQLKTQDQPKTLCHPMEQCQPTKQCQPKKQCSTSEAVGQKRVTVAPDNVSAIANGAYKGETCGTPSDATSTAPHAAGKAGVAGAASHTVSPPMNSDNRFLSYLEHLLDKGSTPDALSSSAPTGSAAPSASTGSTAPTASTGSAVPTAPTMPTAPTVSAPLGVPLTSGTLPSVLGLLGAVSGIPADGYGAVPPAAGYSSTGYSSTGYSSTGYSSTGYSSTGYGSAGYGGAVYGTAGYGSAEYGAAGYAPPAYGEAGYEAGYGVGYGAGYGEPGLLSDHGLNEATHTAATDSNVGDAHTDTEAESRHTGRRPSWSLHGEISGSGTISGEISLDGTVDEAIDDARDAEEPEDAKDTENTAEAAETTEEAEEDQTEGTDAADGTENTGDTVETGDTEDSNQPTVTPHEEAAPEGENSADSPDERQSAGEPGCELPKPEGSARVDVDGSLQATVGSSADPHTPHAERW